MFKGVTFGFNGKNGYFASPQAKQEVERMAELGIPWVCLVVTIMQDAFHSTRMYRDFLMTPSDDEIIALIDLLHAKGIQVMLRPMIECWDGTQRGQIFMPFGCIYEERPIRYRDEWFQNYSACTRHFLRIASQTGCEAYGLDSELNLLVEHSGKWKELIGLARSLYHGHLTTSLINTEQYLEYLDDKEFWLYSLDSVGTSFYYAATKDGTGSVKEMVEFLRPHAEKMKRFAEKLGTCFYLGECGCCSTEKGTILPYYWKNGTKYDGQQQAGYLEAVIRLFSEHPWWGGMFWWKWDENYFRPQFKSDPAGDRGFTIYGKPAAEIMRKWCAGSLQN